jgi:hypothetical protein
LQIARVLGHILDTIVYGRLHILASSQFHVGCIAAYQSRQNVRILNHQLVIRKRSLDGKTDDMVVCFREWLTLTC